MSGYGRDVAARYLAALSLGAICLLSFTAGVVIERGATLVGIAVVAGVLSLATLADGTLRRLRGSPGPRAEG